MIGDDAGALGPHIMRVAFRYLPIVQALAALFAANNWLRVWQCFCEPTMQGAAFWTGIVLAQAVVLMGVRALRS